MHLEKSFGKNVRVEARVIDHYGPQLASITANLKPTSNTWDADDEHVSFTYKKGRWIVDTIREYSTHTGVVEAVAAALNLDHIEEDMVLNATTEELEAALATVYEVLVEEAEKIAPRPSKVFEPTKEERRRAEDLSDEYEAEILSYKEIDGIRSVVLKSFLDGEVFKRGL